MRRMSFWYLATPYSAYEDGLSAAHERACANAALLVRAGIPVYAPIAHTHSIGLAGDIDLRDHGIWMAADKPFMDAAHGLIVCMIDGWWRSYGVAEEIRTFVEAGKPIVYMQADILPDKLPDVPTI